MFVRFCRFSAWLVRVFQSRLGIRPTDVGWLPVLRNFASCVWPLLPSREGAPRRSASCIPPDFHPQASKWIARSRAATLLAIAILRSPFTVWRSRYVRRLSTGTLLISVSCIRGIISPICPPGCSNISRSSGNKGSANAIPTYQTQSANNQTHVVGCGSCLLI